MSDTDRIRLNRLESSSRELAERLARLEARVLDAPAASSSIAVLAGTPPEVPTGLAYGPLVGRESSQRGESAAFFANARRRPADRAMATAAPTGSIAGRRMSLSASGDSFEDLLAGRVLAWAGAVAVLVGIVLLFAVAISRGWIGEGVRTGLGLLVSTALVVVGCWSHERRGRTDAALAAVAAGVAGLFVTVVVATRIYELIPTAMGVSVGLAVGALTTSLALRWRDAGIAGLGIVGGLLAPVLVDAPQDGATLALVFTAALAAAGVCVYARWDWLGLAACAAVTPQWVGYVVTGPGSPAALATLVAFGSVAAVAAVGFELREPTAAVRPVSVLLLAFNGFLLAAVGWIALDQHPLWLIGLAGTHAGVGVGLLRNARASRPVGVLATALGAVLADLALLQLLDGPALTVGWAAATVGFAALVSFAAARGGALDNAAAGAGLAAHVALALVNAVMADVPPEAVLAGSDFGVAASGALAALAAACLTSGLVLADRPRWQALLNGAGVAATAYLVAANLDGVPLVAAWAAEAIALAELARRRRDSFALRMALWHLGLAVGHVLWIEAPPSALFVGLAQPLPAALAIAACIVAAWRCAAAAATFAAVDALEGDHHGDQPSPDAAPATAFTVPVATTGALLALHLVSVQIVTVASAGAQAQTLLSVFWGAAGVVALLVGLTRDRAALRTGALWLLLGALAKVFLYDLAALTSIARVVSFVVLGMLLLLGAFAWQRIRPRPLPDLREAAPGVRR